MQDIAPESKECRIDVSSEGDMTILAIAGHIAEMDAERLARVLDEVFEQESYRLIFDLSNVSYMTSSGLGQLMRSYRVTGENGGFIRIVDPQPLVADIFRVTKLTNVFEIYPDLDTALRAGS